jgi:hypothetical protein
MPPVGFELTISASELPQTNALSSAVSETGKEIFVFQIMNYQVRLRTKSSVTNKKIEIL